MDKVVKLTHENAKKWILEKHYAHRLTPTSEVFGVIVDGVLQGICAYGTPQATFKFDSKIYELKRLVTNDDVPKNTLSQFVARTLQMFPEPAIIVSYADENQGHYGYIYQATNWIYTGRSAAENKYFVDGEEVHRRTLYSRYGTSSIPKLKEMGLDITMEEQVGKHRYFQTTGNKSEQRKLKKEILEKYDEKPYPKGENKYYDSGEPIKQKLFY